MPVGKKPCVRTRLFFYEEVIMNCINGGFYLLNDREKFDIIISRGDTLFKYRLVKGLSFPLTDMRDISGRVASFPLTDTRDTSGRVVIGDCAFMHSPLFFQHN